MQQRSASITVIALLAALSVEALSGISHRSSVLAIRVFDPHAIIRRRAGSFNLLAEQASNQTLVGIASKLVV